MTGKLPNNMPANEVKKPVFRGALGYWSNVLLLENEFVPWFDVSVAGNSFRGVSTGTTAVDCACNLLSWPVRRSYGGFSNPEALVVQTFDYKIKMVLRLNWMGIQKRCSTASNTA